ncbi:MAG TPA: patatin-like phospholipase family protein [Planktothrix sp.]|jgi:NTE family protein
MNIALAFGGGGLRCAAEIGVLRTLKRRNIKIQGGAGTSFGSVVLGLHAMGVDLDAIADLFISGKIIRTFITAPVALQVAKMPFLTIMRQLRSEECAGLFSGNEFRDFLNNLVGHRRIEDAEFPLAIVVTDLESQKVRSITSGDFGLAVQASSSVPGLFCPVRIDGSLCIDGGALENLPISSVKNLVGVDAKVLAVNVNPLPNRNGSQKLGVLDLVDQLLTTHFISIDSMQSGFAEAVVMPDHGVRGWLSRRRNEELMEKAIAIGEDSANSVLDALTRRDAMRMPWQNFAPGKEPVQSNFGLSKVNPLHHSYRADYAV